MKKPQANNFVLLFTLIWMMGVILFDKHFAYISLGPFYITEMLLVAMIGSNLSLINWKDIGLISAVTFFFIGGVIKGHNMFFAIRDLAWLYYLLFLRFFPRNFPKQFVEIVVYTCAIRVIIIIAQPLMSTDLFQLLNQKYRDGAVVIFLAGYLSISQPSGRLTFLSAIFLGVISYLSDYKTLMMVIFLLPVLLLFNEKLSKLHTPKPLAIFSLFLLLLIYNGYAETILVQSVHVLNIIFAELGVSKTYGSGTAQWRAAIWTGAISKLVSFWDILFGEFPGHNFLNSKFLGTKIYFSGAETLGVVRSAHNILVQIMMKTGLSGLLIYGFYYFNLERPKNKTLEVIRFLSLMLALTADILEVPSRGPLLFCFFIILDNLCDEVRI